MGGISRGNNINVLEVAWTRQSVTAGRPKVNAAWRATLAVAAGQRRLVSMVAPIITQLGHAIVYRIIKADDSL